MVFVNAEEVFCLLWNWNWVIYTGYIFLCYFYLQDSLSLSLSSLVFLFFRWSVFFSLQFVVESKTASAKYIFDDQYLLKNEIKMNEVKKKKRNNQQTTIINKIKIRRIKSEWMKL